MTPLTSSPWLIPLAVVACLACAPAPAGEASSTATAAAAPDNGTSGAKPAAGHSRSAFGRAMADLAHAARQSRRGAAMAADAGAAASASGSADGAADTGAIPTGVASVPAHTASTQASAMAESNLADPRSSVAALP